MNEPVLVIMAAGMGSRFGGLKQITPIDDKGHKIIDYSLYDARRAGFRKVVFIIKHAIEEEFRAAVGKRMERYFDVRYVFQEVDKVPEGFAVPEGRTKPWGTGHAIACAKDAIDGPFAVLNADDYYGADAIQTIYDFLKVEREPGDHAMVGYQVRNTVTENGSVSRGVCSVKNGMLEYVTERTHIEKRGTDAAFSEDGGETFTDLSGDTIVSMNLWGFQQQILDEFTGRFPKFLEDNLEKNPMKCEYYLPSVANAQIDEGLGTVQVLPTKAVWYGMTYSEDLISVRNALAQMTTEKIYPEELWMEPAAAYHFDLDGAPYSIEGVGSGHVNATWLLTSTTGKRYTLQRISEAFDIPGMMKNIEALTHFVEERSEDPKCVMHLLKDQDGDVFYTDETGNYRVYDFVDGICLDTAESTEVFRQSAIAFGSFQQMLADFPAETLCESIPNFHNTIDRLRIFHEKLDADVMGRAAEVKEEIAFILAHEEEAGVLQRMRESGELPLRVTHNDTKLNNVVLDEQTLEALCVIDLDTVMPGLSLYDFGDAIRFGASTAAEDELDLSKVQLNLELFRSYTKGFLESCDLTEREIDLLPMGAKIMTLECGIRFLTDYLDGDHYFTIHREKHNLDRCRTQFKLVSEMEKNWDKMAAIVEEERK